MNIPLFILLQNQSPFTLEENELKQELGKYAFTIEANVSHAQRRPLEINRLQ